MKRIICAFLTFLFVFSIAGCQNNKQDIMKPVHLYFCRTETEFQTADGLFAPEQREFTGWENQIREFLNQYLSGPTSTDLVSPFPAGGWIVELSQNNSTVDILLSVNFTRLSPNELTTACACISLTVFELLEAETVNFRITSLDPEESSFTMSRNTLLLSDSEGIS